MSHKQKLFCVHSAASAGKRNLSVAAAGALGSYIHDDAVGAMVILSCETDFVAKNPEFETLARDIAMQVTATELTYVSMDEVSEDAKAGGDGGS